MTIPDTIVQGKVFVVGDDVNTDEIIPARYCATTNLDALGAYALEDLHAAKNPAGVPFTPGQYPILVAGTNFGCGSSREVAPIALARAGVKAIIARSFAPIFYRNAVNIGLPISRAISLVNGTKTHGTLSLDLASDFFWTDMLPLHRSILQAGGLIAFNRRREHAEQPSAPPRPMTIAEKILARAARIPYVEPGMLVMAEVDRVVAHEFTLPVAVEQLHAAYGAEHHIIDPEKILFVADHTVQIPLVRNDPASQGMIAKSAEYASHLKLPHAFLPPAPYTSRGICHVLFPEQGLIEPDTLIVGTDSHTCTYGAYGAYAVGIGNTDLTEIMAWGRILLTVPETVQVQLEGRLPHGVYAKDAILRILSQVTMNGFTDCAIEFTGLALPHLSADDRSTIANMVVEGGAVCGIFPVGRLRADEDAIYQRRLSFNLDALEPYAACPFRPDQGVAIKDIGDVPINLAWIGSCTGGKLEDIAAAAQVVRGRHIAAGVRFIVAPATLKVMAEAGQRGYLQGLLDAGAMIAQPGCGACIGMGPGATREGDVAVFASNRNFKGRTGAGRVYLASPATVAASALAGRIQDPREYLDDLKGRRSS